MTPQQKISRAITHLVVKDPFIGSMALGLQVYPDDNIPTACTDGSSLQWNPSFIDKLTPAETIGLVVHEVMHVVLKHPLRMRERDADRWNVATDYAINEFVVAHGYTLPDGGLLSNEYKGLPAEAIYDRLPDDAGQQSGGFGEVVEPKKKGQPLSPSEAKQMEAAINSKVFQASANAKAVGKMTKRVEELVNSMKKNTIDLHDVVYRFVGGDQPDDYTFSKPNRKAWHQHRAVAPSIQRDGVGHIVVGIDTSASMTTGELQRLLGVLNAMSEDLTPASITVITCDAVVGSVRVYDAGEIITDIQCTGRGGTRVTPVFDYVREHGVQCDSMIYMSDMFIFDYPEEPEYPVLWISTSEKGTEPPFGRVVQA